MKMYEACIIRNKVIPIEVETPHQTLPQTLFDTFDKAKSYLMK